MSDDPYELCSPSWTFEAAGEHWQCSGNTNGVDFEETRKNGQEDTHMGGTARLNPKTGRWEIEEYNIREYLGEQGVAALLEFFQTHGGPR